MGTMEKKARSERRWGSFQKGLLACVAIGGVVSVAAIAPNAVQLLKFFPGHKKGARFTYQAKSALARLAEKGLVTFEERDGNRYPRVTEKGERVLQIEVEKTVCTKKRKWDRRWRVVAFDISEKRRSVRVSLRRFMSEYGFVRLQDSLWVYPYDCEDIIALIKAELRVGTDVLYMIVEHLEGDTRLREHFRLPKEEK